MPTTRCRWVMACGTSESLATTAALTMVITGWAGHIGPGLKVTSMTRRIKKNDLTAWFLEDHATLPASYLKSCQKFFDEIKQNQQRHVLIAGAVKKRQAASDKQQASSGKLDKPQAPEYNKIRK